MPLSCKKRLLPLPAREVHIWTVLPEQFGSIATEGERWLAGPERDQIARFHFATDQQLHRAARIFQRWVLSQYTRTSPAEWSFATNAYGKPYVSAPPEFRELCFNLSHSPGIVGCVVTQALEAGIDVERLDRRVEPLAICERFFAPEEVAALRSLPADHQHAAFFRYWTLKEAYIKARGMGLSLPLDSFAFRLNAQPWRLWTQDGTAAQTECWRFAAFDAGAPFAAAVCVRAPDAPVTVCRYTVGPDLKPQKVPAGLLGSSAGITTELKIED